jgi:hypothetical protein
LQDLALPVASLWSLPLSSSLSAQPQAAKSGSTERADMKAALTSTTGDAVGFASTSKAVAEEE